MSRPDPIEYAERLYGAIRAANFSPMSFLAFGNAVKEGVAMRSMPRIAVEPFMRIVGEMLELEEASAPEVLRGRRIVERALPQAVKAEHLLGRDLQGDDDVLQFAALVEHLERLRGDLACGVLAGHPACGGCPDHVGRVVAPDAVGVALGVQRAPQTHVVYSGDADAELPGNLGTREAAGRRLSGG